MKVLQSVPDLNSGGYNYVKHIIYILSQNKKCDLNSHRCFYRPMMMGPQDGTADYIESRVLRRLGS